MQELDLKLAFILLPIVYSVMPFLLSGNLLLLGTVSVSVFIIGSVLFVLIFSLNIAGSGDILASGVSGSIGLNGDGTRMLFILVFGGLFYGLTTFIFTFMDALIGIYNFLFGWLGLTIETYGSNISIGSYTIVSPSSIYPNDFAFSGVPIFPTLSVLMGLVYIVGIYFLISNK
jgi:hypothetical protein